MLQFGQETCRADQLEPEDGVAVDYNSLLLYPKVALSNFHVRV